MVTTYYPPYNYGGDGIYVRTLARALVSRGHDVTVVHCKDAYRKNVPGNIVQTQDPEAVKVHGIHHSTGLASLLITHQLGVPGLNRRKLESILSQPFDVVNFHNISLIGGLGVIPLSRAPVNLFTLHEHWLLCPTHVFWKNRKAACDSRQCIRCCIRSGVPPQFWRYTTLVQRSLEKIDCLISPSEYTADKHRELLKQPGRMEVISLCSNLAPEHSAYEGAGAPDFLYVGRITASKGVAQLLGVFARNPDLGLTLIGGGELLTPLKREFASHRNIRFLGKLPQRQLIDHYRRTTALIMPSLAPETFGLAVIEAFSCGAPAIVRNAGGNQELLRNSGAGFVYHNEQELLDALHAFKRDPSLRVKLGSSARQAYEKFYTEDVHLARYLKLIDSIMEQKTGRNGNSA